MTFLSKRRLSLHTKDNLWAYFFIAPWIVGFFAFTASPMIASLYYSFTEYNVLTSPEWIGLDNYSKLFTDPLFWQSLKVTLKFAVLSLPLNLVVGYLLAVLLNQKLATVNFWRTLYYVPSVISGVAVAVLWARLFNPNLGWINFVLGKFGINGPGWLKSPDWAVPALVIMSLWSVGGTMIIYLSSLQGVPTTLYDAAKVDGANKFQTFLHVTLPMTTPAIFFNLVTGLIDTFQYFTIAYTASAGTGGPDRSTLFYNLYLYKNAFSYFEMGYASAMAWVLLFIVMGLTLLIFKTSARWVFYEGEVRS